MKGKKMYCDIKGKILNFLNNCLQESVGLELVIFLITLSVVERHVCVELPQKIIP
jgi:hypothetical protein